MSWLAIAGASAVGMAITLPAGAADGADGPPTQPGVEVIASGLEGPFQLSMTPWGAFYVVETAAGQITQVEPWNGETNPVITGLGNPSGVAVDQRGTSWIVTGAAGGPPEEGAPPPPPAPYPASLLAVDRWIGAIETKADLEAYELDENPDGQLQFGDDGIPPDALSNPFALVTRPGGVIVTDGGGNDVLSVNRDGTVSTLFVPPTITSGPCAEQPNNAPGTFGCDSVPTGLAWGPDGSLYISALNSFAPGLGAVYQINPYSGEIIDSWSGFTAPLGVAVGDDGAVYVSEGLYGSPEGEGPPPDGFDPSTVGRIVKVAPDGARTYAAVTMSAGLLWDDGELFASAWSLAAQFGIPGAGQVVRVHPEAFVAA